MRTLILATVAMLSLASAAQAGGINLAWNDCGSFGSPSKTFACNTNSGFQLLFVSFAPPTDVSDFRGAQGVIDISSSLGTLPPWWSLSVSGGCRSGLSFSSNFLTGPFSCADPWNGDGTGGVQYTYQFQGSTNHARLLWVITNVTPVALTSGVEFYAVLLSLNALRTVGTNACAGCLDPICVVAQDVELLRNDGVHELPSVLITNPILSQSVTWQTGVTNCPGATPTRASTWGSVKALYR